jgi:hypothetical protein
MMFPPLGELATRVLSGSADIVSGLRTKLSGPLRSSPNQSVAGRTVPARFPERESRISSDVLRYRIRISDIRADRENT